MVCAAKEPDGRGFQTTKRDVIGLAYAVLPEFWNRGFATEMAQASLEGGFRQLNFSEIDSWTLPDQYGFTAGDGENWISIRAGLRFRRATASVLSVDERGVGEVRCWRNDCIMSAGWANEKTSLLRH